MANELHGSHLEQSFRSPQVSKKLIHVFTNNNVLHLSKTKYENVYSLQKTLNPDFLLDNISILNIGKMPPS